MEIKMKDYYSVDDFFTIDKIDAHLHYYSENTSFLKLAEQNNIRLLSINVDFMEDEWMALEKQVSISKKMMQHNLAFFAYLGAVPMANQITKSHISKAVNLLTEEVNKGAVGVKIWKNVGMKIAHKDAYLMIDNPIFQPILGYLSENKIPLLGHFGEPRNCWLPIDQMTVLSDQKYYSSHPEFHMFLHPEMPAYEDQINACNNMLENNSGLNFIGAHLGSSEYSIDEMAKRLDKYPNMMFDMAERICHLQHQSITNHQDVYDFLIKYQDRLMYGSDMVFTDSKDEQEQVKDVKDRWIKQWCFLTQKDEQTTWEVIGSYKGMGLPQEVIDKIYYHNALKTYPLLAHNF